MARVKGGTTTRRRHKAVLKATRGHRAARSRRYKVARESLTHALAYATAHRRLKKRTNRSLQIVRINAAALSTALCRLRVVVPPRKNNENGPGQTDPGPMTRHWPITRTENGNFLKCRK